MMIFLLEECNLSCEHCLREDEPMTAGYKLTYGQLKLCLLDCQKLQAIEWVHFSGGEPTLWTDGERDLTDLLIEISKAGFEPGFTSNGCYFNDYNKGNDFLQKFFNGAKKPLRLYLSIDTFHHNFEIEKGRAKSLDNILKWKMEVPAEIGKLLSINVLSTISKDTKSLLPTEMVENYQSLGITFNFIPMKARGKAKSFSHLCPNTDSDDPKEMGAYYRFHQKKKGQDVKSNIVLIGNDYYLPEPWRKIAQLGHMPKEIIDVFKKDH
ncbi:radical SAM protein [[Eubacterium] cellulosolvens]